jgi:cytochrome c oxidase accessory protein FixG
MSRIQHRIPPAASERVLSTLNEDGSRFRIHPRLSPGRFLLRRRLVGYFLIALFVALPYIYINGKPSMLLDLARREFTFFGTTFLPTDSLLLMLLGLGIALSVFIFTALFGRVWCGWGCPQTVYMELVYRPIERLIEGSPQQQRQLDDAGFSRRRAIKYGVFLLVSIFVAHTFLAYFVGVEQLYRWVQSSPAEHPVAFLIMAGVTGLMFFDFAYFREQMCIVACPYGRLQSVLIDRQSLIVGYDSARGEPRGKLAKGKVGQGDLGDCIDCKACVYTCPTGIDIRDGVQMECIGCTQCIDACDAIMDRVKRPRGLIRYTSQDELANEGRRLLRPRVIVYPLLLVIVFGLFVVNLGGKAGAEVTVLRNAAAPFSVLPTGEVSSPIRFRIINRTGDDRDYRFELLDAKGTRLIAPRNPVPVGAGDKMEAGFMVVSPPEAFAAGRHPVRLRVSDGGGFEEVIEYTLLGPQDDPHPTRGNP